jgi:hypothetical protein
VSILLASLSTLVSNRQIGRLHVVSSRREATSTAQTSNEEDWRSCCSPPTGTNLVYPHMVARYSNGTFGMVVDPSVKHLFHDDSNYSNPFLCPGRRMPYGIEGKGGNTVLYKIRRGLKKARNELGTNATWSVRILCLIYTVHNEESHHSALAAIARTWGRQCDGFIGASNLTDHLIGVIDLPHEGPEEYANMWQKIRSIWTYAYDNFVNDYDFFFIAGDDTYVLVDHLRLYLKSDQVKKLEDGHLDRISQYFAAAGANQTSGLRPVH